MLNSQGLYWGCYIQHLEKHFEEGTKDYYSQFMDTGSSQTSRRRILLHVFLVHSKPRREVEISR